MSGYSTWLPEELVLICHFRGALDSPIFHHFSVVTPRLILSLVQQKRVTTDMFSEELGAWWTVFSIGLQQGTLQSMGNEYEDLVVCYLFGCHIVVSCVLQGLTNHLLLKSETILTIFCYLSRLQITVPHFMNPNRLHWPPKSSKIVQGYANFESLPGFLVQSFSCAPIIWGGLSFETVQLQWKFHLSSIFSYYYQNDSNARGLHCELIAPIEDCSYGEADQNKREFFLIIDKSGYEL